MKSDELLKLLQAVESGKLISEAALAKLKHLPFEDIGFAKVDHHRALRQGYAEVIAAVKRVSRAAKFHPLSGVITIERSSEISGKGTILVVSAGTSDIPV